MTCLQSIRTGPQGHAAFAEHTVILHKDAHHLIPHVVFALKRVVSLDETTATDIAQKAWVEGTAVVVVCPKEVAEHYQVQLTSHGLLVTVER